MNNSFRGPLPIPLPNSADRTTQRGARRGQEVFAVGNPVTIFAPAHLADLGREVGCTDLVMYADLGATHEIALRLLTYRVVVETGAAHGIVETEPNRRNRISRGGFSAGFFVSCLAG